MGVLMMKKIANKSLFSSILLFLVVQGCKTEEEDELCPSGYSLCRTTEEEGICAARSTCLFVNDPEICSTKNSCFEDEIMSCYNHKACKDVIPFNKTQDFCASKCKDLIKKMALSYSSLSSSLPTEKLKSHHRLSPDHKYSRELSKFHTCLGICNVDGFPNEEIPLGHDFMRLNCAVVQDKSAGSIRLRKCNLFKDKDIKNCNDSMGLIISSNSHGFPSETRGMPLKKRYLKPPKKSDKGFDHGYWSKWYKHEFTDLTKNKKKSQNESVKKIDNPRDPQNKPRLQDIKLFFETKRNSKEKTTTRNSSTRCEIEDKGMTTNVNFSELNCTKTYLHCFFQDSNCSKEEKNGVIKIDIKNMWKDDSSITDSCSTSIDLRVSGYLVENSFWNLTCDAFQNKNKTLIPRSLLNACVYRWYEGRIIYYDESSCALNCSEPSLECDTYWGTICAESMSECKFLHGERKEKVMELAFGSVSPRLLTLENLGLYPKGTKNILIEKVYSKLAAVQVSESSGKWNNISEGMLITTNSSFNISYPTGKSGVVYITLQSNITGFGKELLKDQRRLLGFIHGYDFRDLRKKEVEFLSNDVRVDVRKLIPEELFEYWLEHQMLLSSLEEDLSVGIYQGCNSFVERIKTSRLYITLISGDVEVDQLFLVDYTDRYFTFIKNLTMVSDPFGAIELVDISMMEQMKILDLNFSFNMDIDYYSSNNDSQRQWTATLKYRIYRGLTTIIETCIDGSCTIENDPKPGKSSPNPNISDSLGNRAPVVRIIRPKMDLLAADNLDDDGYSIKHLIDTFYEDPDNDALGIGIFLAQSSFNHGHWQTRLENGSWKEIGTDPGSLKYFNSRLTPDILEYEGPFDITKELYEVMCEENINPCNLTVSGCSSVYSLMTEEFIEDRKTRNPPKASGVSSKTTANFPVLLLSGKSRLRYLTSNRTQALSRLDSFMYANLLFTAWDGSNNRISWDDILVDMPYCCGACGENNSLARDIYRLVAKSKDCDGTPIMDGQTKVDECGVCGGSNDCKDCKGIINGEHFISCGKCIGPKEKGGQDCNGECNAHKVVSIDGKSFCVPKFFQSNKPKLYCDGRTQSNATVNNCGVCYEGTTQMNETSNINECGECMDIRWGTPMDCKSKGVYPRLFDLALSSTCNLYVHDSKLRLNDSGRCTMMDTSTSVSVSSNEVIVEEDNNLMVTFKNFEQTGRFSFACTIKGRSLESTNIYIVDSREILLKEVSVKQRKPSAPIYDVTITLQATIEKAFTAKLVCFYRVAFTSKVMLGAFMSNETTVHCNWFKHDTVSPIVHFGVSLDPKLPLEKESLPTLPHQFDVDSLRIVRGKFYKEKKTVSVVFSTNIEGPSNCSDIFDNRTLELIGYSPSSSKCEYLGETLRVNLGKDHQINRGTKIQFKNSVIRPLHSNQNNITKFRGSVVLLAPLNRAKPSFKLGGRSQFCPDEEIFITAFGITKFTSGLFVCNVTDMEGRSVHSSLDEFFVEMNYNMPIKRRRHSGGQSQPLQTLINKRIQMQIFSQHLRPGQSYRINVVGEKVQKFGSPKKTLPMSKVISIVTKDTPVAISIRGPRRQWPPNKLLKLKAKVKLCMEKAKFRESYKKIQFTWTSKPALSKLKMVGKKVKIERGLKGGQTYKFDLMLEARSKSPGIPNLKEGASLVIKTKSIGPLAFMAADLITFGVENDIILDGGASVDQDNNGEELKYEWHCEQDTADKGCFTTKSVQNNIPSLLRQELHKEAMSHYLMNIPKRTLLPGRYEFTLEAKNKRGKISRKSLSVVIVPGKIGRMEFSRLNNAVDVSKPIVIKALIHDATDVCLLWESIDDDEGYSFVDLQKNSNSGFLKCFKSFKNKRMFNLVIRSNSLFPGANYKLRLTQRNIHFGTLGTAEIILKTHERFNIPSFKILPKEVSPMLSLHRIEFEDNFMFSLQDSSNYSSQLFYSIHENEMTFLTDRIHDQFFIPQILTNTFFLIKMCDEENVCVLKRSSESLVSSPSSGRTKDIEKQKKEFSSLQNEGECLLAISYLSGWTRGIKPFVLDGKLGTHCNLLTAVFLECSSSLAEEAAQSMDYDDVTIAMDLFLKSTCLNKEEGRIVTRKDKSGEGENAGKRVVTSLNLIKNSILNAATAEFEDEEAKPVKDKKKSGKKKRKKKRNEGKFNNIANGNNEGTTNWLEIFSNDTNFRNTFKQRYKRDIKPQGLKSPELEITTRSLSNEQMKVLINWSIKSLASSDDPTTEFQLFLRQVVSNYMKAICKTTNAQSDTEVIQTEDIKMSVLNTELSEESRHSLNSQISSMKSIVLEKSIIKKMKEWSCTDAVTCSGLSVGSIEIKADKHLLDSVGLKGGPEIVSPILGVHLLNPQSCNPIDQSPEDTFQVSVLVNKATPLENRSKREATSFQMQCVVLVDGKWDRSSCETEGFSPKGEDSAIVYCKCSKSGFVAIAMVDSENELTLIKQKYAFQEEVQLKLLEQYDGDLDDARLEDFKASLLERLRQVVGIDSSDIKDLSFIKGPNNELLVNFELVGENEEDAGRLERSFTDLKFLVNAGEFKMKGQNGDPISVPAQCISDCVKKTVTEKAKDYLLPIIIGSVVLACVLFILICIICAVRSKKRRLEEKVKPLTSDSSMAPNYRTLQYAGSLEGTVASMKKMKEDRLKKELGRDIGENVTPPADYKTPTPEHTHRIKSVSPEMVASMTRSLELPGTPENK